MPADIVFRGAIRPSAAAPLTDALAVCDGVVVALGAADCADLTRPATRVIDVDGVVLPGFVDAHVHPAMGGLNRMHCDLDEVHGLAAYRSLIRAYVTTSSSEWIVGSGWYGDVFTGGFPTAAELDSLTDGRPACFMSHDGHGVWVNTAALHRAGIDDTTPDPDGGRIIRDESARATGMLVESAANLVTDLLPAPTESEIQRALLEAQSYLHSVGIVGWQDAGVGECLGLPDTFEAYRALDSSGALTARVTGDLWWQLDGDLTQIEGFVRRRETTRDARRFRTTGIKVMQDGVCENLTAAVLEPYRGHPHQHGLSFLEPAWLGELVGALAAADFDVHLHAVGDRAVREALDAIESAPHRSDARHQIAHIDLIDAADIDRFKRLGVIANVSPLWAREDRVLVETKLPYLTDEQRRRHFAFSSLHDAGTALAFGSDWPVSSPDPLWAIHVAVNRTAPQSDPHAADAHAQRVPLLPDEGLDVVTAVHAATAGAAHASRLDRNGSLEVGMAADLVLLDRDPITTAPDELSTIRVHATYVDGAPVFTA